MNKGEALAFRFSLASHSLPLPNASRNDDKTRYYFGWEGISLRVMFSNKNNRFFLFQSDNLIFETDDREEIIEKIKEHFPYRTSVPIPISYHQKSKSF